MNLPRTPSLRVDGQRALVTGAGRGIGLAAASALATAGAHVVLLARSRTEIETGAEAILAEGGSAEALACDVLDLDKTQSAIAERGSFDILINNAGTNRPKPLMDVTEEDFDAVVDLNVKAAYFVAQAVVAGMLAAKKRGSLIHISSQMGHVGGRERTL